MDSVVEFFDCLIVCSLIVSKFSHFSLFHPSLFIQYSTEECSTVQLLASSLEYPERIRVDSVVETLVCLSVCVFFVSKFSNFSLFHSSIFIQYSTEECSTVQYKAAGPVRAVISIRYGSKEGVQGSLLVAQYIRP